MLAFNGFENSKSICQKCYAAECSKLQELMSLACRACCGSVKTKLNTTVLYIRISYKCTNAISIIINFIVIKKHF